MPDVDLLLAAVVALLFLAGLLVLTLRWSGQRRDDGDRLAARGLDHGGHVRVLDDERDAS